MRQALYTELSGIEERIIGDLDLAELTANGLAEVLADPSQPTPGFLERNARRIRESARIAVERLVLVLARQAPVAGDLRLVAALLQVTAHEALIANQFDLITEQLMEIDPDEPPEREIAAMLESMARLAAREIHQAADALTARDPEAAEEVARADREINALNRRVFAQAGRAIGSPARRATSMHLMLIARSIERLGDNAVDIAEQAAFVATGVYREFTDASHPATSVPDTGT
ncbi:MAG TPA: phosphate uptake regulator PhoU [Solirubrobacteraceae bacterium]|nr:phosphate uptake regulator PhoU [Solirubrobacteraceae bacterium]